MKTATVKLTYDQHYLHGLVRKDATQSGQNRGLSRSLSKDDIKFIEDLLLQLIDEEYNQ